MILPAISIKEPWAGMIRAGEKRIEVRTWQTKHRGRIVLCASASPRSDISGHAFAVAKIVDVRPMRPDDKRAAGGIYAPGAYAWVLDDIKPCRPFPVKGRLGIFKIDTKKKSPVN